MGGVCISGSELVKPAALRYAVPSPTTDDEERP